MRKRGFAVDMKTRVSMLAAFALSAASPSADASAQGAPTNSVVAIGTVLVEGTALSKYRPEKVSGGSFTDVAPALLPCVVDTLTEDFIRERNPKPLA